MKNTISVVTLAGLVVLQATIARAQTTASGSAFSAKISVGGSPPQTTGETSATAPNPANTPAADAVSSSANGAVIPGAPLFNVIGGPSQVRACTRIGGCPELFSLPSDTGALDPALLNRQFVRTDGGGVVAAVFIGLGPGGADGLDAVSGQTTVQFSCNPTGNQFVQDISTGSSLLTIGGNPVPIPGNPPPNTTIVNSGGLLAILNEQDCPAPAAGLPCMVTALHVTIPALLDLALSSATAQLANTLCNNACMPSLNNSRKNSLVLQANRMTPKTPQSPAVGDPIRFTITVPNGVPLDQTCPAGSQTAHNVRIVDRVPRGIDVDLASITLRLGNAAATPATGTLASCPNVPFEGCPGETPTDTSRQCLTVTDGDIAPGQTLSFSFIGVVNSSATGGAAPGCDQTGVGQGICNVVLIRFDESPTPLTRVSRIQCASVSTPTPTPTRGGGGGGGPTRTPTPTATPTSTPTPTIRVVLTGGGGCSLGGNSPTAVSEMAPILAIVLLLGRRQWRRRASRAVRGEVA